MTTCAFWPLLLLAEVSIFLTVKRFPHLRRLLKRSAGIPAEMSVGVTVSITRRLSSPNLSTSERSFSICILNPMRSRTDSETMMMVTTERARTLPGCSNQRFQVSFQR